MKNGMSSQIIVTFVSPRSTLTVGIGTVIVIYIGSNMFISGFANPGDITAFTIYMAQILMSLIMITNIFNTFVRTKASTVRIKEVLNCGSDFIHNNQVKELNGDIKFNDVTFAYPNGSGVPALKNLSFSIKGGQSLAIIGPTGSGKSTIAWLLLRFYDVNSGRILIDNEPINNLKRSSLRKYFSVVLQDTCLFTGSIMDNIRYLQGNATDEEVINAAKIARAHDFISKLPKGYYTMVSGVADNLSQGQRQLIAIARAVLCDSPILILDEATSSVDTKTEKDIQHALASLMKNRTSFLIAHRLSTIRDADYIMVIGDGKIPENGSRKAFMETKGQYYKMVISQVGNSDLSN